MSVDNNLLPRNSEREDAGVDVLGFFGRRKWLILFGLVVGLGLGYLKYLRDPAVYRSSGRVNVIKEHARLPIGGGNTVEPMAMRIDLRSDIELIMSETIVTPAIEGDADFGDPGSDTHIDIPDLSDLEMFAGADNPTGRVISGLKVSQLDVGSSVLVISFEGSNPKDCGSIINNVIRSYQSYLQASYQNVANEAVELLSEAKNDIFQDLRDNEAAILLWHQEADPGVSGSTNIHQTRMDAIELERADMQIRRGRLDTQLKQIQAAVDAEYSREAILLMVQQLEQDEDAVGGDTRPFDIAQQIFPLILEEAELLERYGEDHPSVIAKRRQIEMTRSFLEENLPESASHERVDFLTLFIQAMELELGQLDAQIAELDGQYLAEADAARQLISKTLELQNLQRDQERLQSLWEGVVTLLQNLEITQGHGEYRAEIISMAGPGHKIAPNLYSSLPIGGILGMLAGMLLATIAEMADKSFKTPAEISSILGVRVIGHTPVFPRSVSSRGAAKSKLDPSLIAHYSPKSRSAEAFRAIRTALYFSSRGNRLRVIQMTSPEPRDGKSTMTANLAISIAQSGKKVMLIDADFRRPRVHHLFGLTDKVGMSSAIMGDVELPEAIQSTEVENLDCLPCGPRPDNPAELLTSAKFDELLAVLRDKYDYVLVDSPPILAVTDPGAIASRVDGVLVTLRINAQARHTATQSVEILRELGANLLGVIVNGVDAGGSYGYRGYNYAYSYSQYQSRTSSYYAETESKR